MTIPAGTIRSKGLTLRNKTREVTFRNAVEARLVPDAGRADASPPRRRDAGTGAALISATNGPIDVTPNRLDIDDTGKIATFSGDVRAAQGDAVLETSALEVHYEGGGTGARLDRGSRQDQAHRLARARRHDARAAGPRHRAEPRLRRRQRDRAADRQRRHDLGRRTGA